MPIDVRWEEMDWGKNVAGPAPTRVLDIVSDDHSLVERFLADIQSEVFPYLGFISRETVTVFHHQHIAQLATELEILSTHKHDPEVANQIYAVRRLIASAREYPDTLIVFRVR